MASSGSITTNQSHGRSITLSWTLSSQSVTNNTSTIAWTLKGSGGSGWVTSGAFKAIIDGTTVYSSATRIDLYADQVIATGTKTITHNADGTRSFSLSCEAGVYTYAVSVTASGSHTLDRIARASTVSFSNTNIGSAGTVAITRASSSFTHTLTYSFGSITGTIATKTSSTSVSWTPPLSLANQLPNSTSGKVTITCATYSGSTLIGSKTCTATLNVPTSMKPTFTSLTATRVDGSVPTSWGIYVQNKSKATLTIVGAAGSYSSTIAAYSITGGGISSSAKTYTTGFLTSAGTITFTAKVQDTRGRWSNEQTVSIAVVAYSVPTFSNYNTQRCDSSGVVNTNGTYGKGTVQFSFASCSGKNTITTAVAYKKSSSSSYTNTPTTFTSKTPFTFGEGNLSTDYSYDIRYTLTDAFGSTVVVDKLSTASVLMDFKSGGLGIGIGKVAETDRLLDCQFNAKFRGGVSGSVLSLDGNDGTITSDFNNYIDIGVYKVSSNSAMAEVKNRPCEHAGVLYVKNAFNDLRDSTGTWVYRMQIFIPYDGTNLFLRSITVEGTAGTWTYGSWNTIGADMNVNYASSAGKATKDGSGNTITSTYLKLSGGTVTGTTTFSRSTDASGTADNKPALIIGGSSTGAHMEIDANEIMAKASGTSTASLYINESGGAVYINGYKTFYTSCIGYGSMSQGSTLSGTVPPDTRLFLILLYDTDAWYSMAVPANTFTSGQSLHVKATSDYYTFTITFSSATATLKKTASGTKTVYFMAVR